MKYYIVFKDRFGCELSRYEVFSDKYASELLSIIHTEQIEIFDGDIITFEEE